MNRPIRPAGDRAGLIVGLLLLVVCGAAGAAVEGTPASTDGSAGYLRFERHDDLMSLEAHNVSLQDVLAEIARQCNLRVILHRPLETRISVALQPQPLADALMRLMRQQSYLLHLSQVEDATRIADNKRSGTLWVFSGESTGSPDHRLIEFDRSSDTAATVAALRSELASGDFRRKIVAIESLGQLGIHEAIEPLSLALVDEDRRIRVQAINALADIGGDDTIAVLAGATGDEDAGVREEASYALGLIGGESAIELLKPTLHDADDNVRGAAIEAFTEIGGRQSTTALSVLLSDEDLSTRVDVVDALGEIGGEAASLYLQQALNDEHELVRKTAAEYLTKSTGMEPRRRF